ncbi:MAG: LAGLIDADG family homing endonuclease [Candidatus Nealsonbacteria bacterium]
MPKKKLPDKNFRWTPNLAYIVGLLATDGNLSKDGRHIDFTSKDKNLVELLRRCLSLHNKIGKKCNGSDPKKKYYRIQFGNVVFYHWLQRIGLTPHKSKTINKLAIPRKNLPTSSNCWHEQLKIWKERVN